MPVFSAEEDGGCERDLQHHGKEDASVFFRTLRRRASAGWEGLSGSMRRKLRQSGPADGPQSSENSHKPGQESHTAPRRGSLFSLFSKSADSSNIPAQSQGDSIDSDGQTPPFRRRSSILQLLDKVQGNDCKKSEGRQRTSSVLSLEKLRLFGKKGPSTAADESVLQARNDETAQPSYIEPFTRISTKAPKINAKIPNYKMDSTIFLPASRKSSSSDPVADRPSSQPEKLLSDAAPKADSKEASANSSLTVRFQLPQDSVQDSQAAAGRGASHRVGHTNASCPVCKCNKQPSQSKKPFSKTDGLPTGNIGADNPPSYTTLLKETSTLGYPLQKSRRSTGQLRICSGEVHDPCIDGKDPPNSANRLQGTGGNLPPPAKEPQQQSKGGALANDDNPSHMAVSASQSTFISPEAAPMPDITSIKNSKEELGNTPGLMIENEQPHGDLHEQTLKDNRLFHGSSLATIDTKEQMGGPEQTCDTVLDVNAFSESSGEREPHEPSPKSNKVLLSHANLHRQDPSERPGDAESLKFGTLQRAVDSQALEAPNSSAADADRRVQSGEMVADVDYRGLASQRRAFQHAVRVIGRGERTELRSSPQVDPSPLLLPEANGDVTDKLCLDALEGHDRIKASCESDGTFKSIAHINNQLSANGLPSNNHAHIDTAHSTQTSTNIDISEGAQEGNSEDTSPSHRLMSFRHRSIQQSTLPFARKRANLFAGIDETLKQNEDLFSRPGRPNMAPRAFSGASKLTTASCAIATHESECFDPIPPPEHHRHGIVSGKHCESEERPSTALNVENQSLQVNDRQDCVHIEDQNGPQCEDTQSRNEVLHDLPSLSGSSFDVYRAKRSSSVYSQATSTLDPIQGQFPGPIGRPTSPSRAPRESTSRLPRPKTPLKSLSASTSSGCNFRSDADERSSPTRTRTLSLGEARPLGSMTRPAPADAPGNEECFNLPTKADRLTVGSSHTSRRIRERHKKQARAVQRTSPAKRRGGIIKRAEWRTM